MRRGGWIDGLTSLELCLMQIPEQDMAAFKSLDDEFQALLDQIAYCNSTKDALIIKFSGEMDEEINGLIQASPVLCCAATADA